MRLTSALTLSLLALACVTNERQKASETTRNGQMRDSRIASTPHPSSSAPPISRMVPSATPRDDASVAQGFRRCGALDCREYDSTEAAFEFVLARPIRVLGVGEAHAQKGSESVLSATRRFSDRLLPLLKDRARHLVIELWLSRGDCGVAEKRVAEKQRPIVANQAAGNQAEFLELGNRAKALGVAPHALTPSCEQYRTIAGAGSADIDAMLAMLAETTASAVKRLLGALPKPGPGSPPPMVVAYGGAIHNDIAPRAGRERWSFGPELRDHTRGEYVELDLIVPEFIKDTEAWRTMAWYEAYQAVGSHAGTLVFTVAPSSFALVFPKTAVSAARPEATKPDASATPATPH